MRSKANGSEPEHVRLESNPYFQAGCAAGAIYSRTQAQLNAAAAATGGEISARDIGEWMARQLLFQSRQDESRGLDGAQLLPPVRGHAPRAHQVALLPSGVDGNGNRQTPQRAAKPVNWESLSRREQQRWSYHQAHPQAGYRRKRWKLAKPKPRAGKKLKPGQIAGDRSKIQSAYWARMTPAARSAEALRRAKLRAANKAQNSKPVQKTARTNVMPRGFWQREVSRLLGNGPRPRKEIFGILVNRYPEKRDNLFVTLATMKKKRELLETHGVLSLPASTAPVAPTV